MIKTNQPEKDDGKTEKGKAAPTKKGFAGVFLFYFLVAFEFAYMAGPFAIYFYSVYSPVLNFLNKIPGLSWLIQFFLPHVARDTSSPVIKGIEVLGIIFTITGFVLFIIGAVQIYYSKLTKKGAVVGGLYKFVRHPQYSSFIVCSFGMLLLWPRFIVVILFVSLLFAYMALARAEERECEEKFGDAYIVYRKKTGRFFPKAILREKEGAGTGKKLYKGIAAYLLTLTVFLTVAMGLRALTINSLYAVYGRNSATIALCEMDQQLINRIMTVAKNDRKVQEYLSQGSTEKKELNYILPVEWFAAEIPMNGIVYRKGHRSPRYYDPSKYKIIFTEPMIRNGELKDGKEILDKTIVLKPIVEVWVDVDKNEVTEIKDIPQSLQYDGVPVAIF